ncbi:MAG: prepilin-type N-terminal cleavage/methylation domain-containing protein [Gemmatimonadetes bacterium]|nr:prepilin-type N-terminal cleavage/methylation domain-containing protein [Gemmatimonadota bacterium]
MSRCPCHRSPLPARRGFTLIEVVAALVIFSLGVLMVIRLTTTLERQMRYSATESELVVRAEERLDSLDALDFDSITVGTTTVGLTVQGTSYDRIVAITPVTGVLYRIDVTLSPATAGAGPTYSTTSYRAAIW